MPPTPRRALVVMARAPEEGRVKTRIARTTGPARALAIYRELAETVMRGLWSLERCEVVVAITPDSGGGALAPWLGPGWSVEGQGEGDLGDRMERAIARRFADGANQVVLIGTDTPEADAAVVLAAYDALRSHDVVVGPATDGGYYLIGVRRPEPELFRDVPWSTDQTCAATLERAKARGLAVALVEPLDDIDTEADWEQWVARRYERRRSPPFS